MDSSHLLQIPLHHELGQRNYHLLFRWVKSLYCVVNTVAPLSLRTPTGSSGVLAAWCVHSGHTPHFTPEKQSLGGACRNASVPIEPRRHAIGPNPCLPHLQTGVSTLRRLGTFFLAIFLFLFFPLFSSDLVP